MSTEGEAGGVEKAHHRELVSKKRRKEWTPVADVDVGLRRSFPSSLQMWTETPKGGKGKAVNKDRFIS